MKLLPTLATITAAFAALYLYHYTPKMLIELTDSLFGYNVYKFLNGKYFLDIIYNHYLISSGLQNAYTMSKILDRGTFELIGPYGLSEILTLGSKYISVLDTGIITSYALYIVLGIIIIILILFAPILFNFTISTSYNLLFLSSEFKLFIIYLATIFLIPLSN